MLLVLFNWFIFVMWQFSYTLNLYIMRDLLEEQIMRDFCEAGDTTVLAMILESLSDKYVFGCLSDKNQEKIKGARKFYYEIHVVGKNGFSTSIVSDIELDEEEVIMKAYEDGKLHGNDCHNIDYVDELSFDEWNTHFNFNND